MSEICINSKDRKSSVLRLPVDQKQAWCQRASSNKYFNNGLIEDLLEVFMDPDYQHNTESKGESDCDSRCQIRQG
ncbi:hypothetical protein BS17DRAFT_807259 [Gyrodon lividus]|nr:hypothetical protein BS17DRAFT_807259 [Gyrodon lividus]